VRDVESSTVGSAEVGTTEDPALLKPSKCDNPIDPSSAQLATITTPLASQT